MLELKNVAGPVKPEAASLTLHRGEVLGIAGLVGAGRTEMLRTIFGLDDIKSGEIKVKAYVGPASPAKRWSEGMGMVSEDRKQEGLALSLSIADNVTLSSHRHNRKAGGLRPKLARSGSRDLRFAAANRSSRSGILAEETSRKWQLPGSSSMEWISCC